MVQRRFDFRWRLRRKCVEIEFQNRLHALVTARVQCHSTTRCVLQALFRILVAEPQDSETGTIALLGMTLSGHDAIKDLRCGRADFMSPVKHARGRPFQMLLMGLGAVLIATGGAVGDVGANMRGHPRSTMKDLYCGSGGSYFHLLLRQRIGHTVE